MDIDSREKRIYDTNERRGNAVDVTDYTQPIMLSIPILHVEVCLKQSSILRDDEIDFAVQRVIESSSERLVEDGDLQYQGEVDLEKNCEYIRIVDSDRLSKYFNRVLHFSDVEIKCHVFKLNCDTDAAEERDESDDYAIYFQWILPSNQFDGIWESLVYEEDIKRQLLDYVSSGIAFSDHNVDQNLVAWNRLILLHGPVEFPGTGKTSLCKALAHKMAIRFSSRYKCGMLIEVNAHSLFSKWFSESGKLVMKLFDYIYELIADRDVLVIVLVDEIESLSAARQKALSGSEPADSIRVVNALLTQMDKLRTKSNVLILTTSNITEAIDDAMIDRADLKLFIPLPGPSAVYAILKTALEELMRVGIIKTRRQLLDYQACYLLRDVESETTRYSSALRRIALECKVLSPGSPPDIKSRLTIICRDSVAVPFASSLSLLTPGS